MHHYQEITRKVLECYIYEFCEDLFICIEYIEIHCQMSSTEKLFIS